jgi:Calcineurin-like phosphoesterase
VLVTSAPNTIAGEGEASSQLNPNVQSDCADIGSPGSMIVFISDLHLGLGKVRPNEWNPWEDFRWSKAFTGFLNAISNEGHDNVTLVIVGDLFEMWQHPKPCQGLDPDHGCSIAEVSDTLKTIIEAHRAELKAVGDFANRGSNSVVILPGNHDAALLVPQIWEEARNNIPIRNLPVPGSTSRLSFASCGAWQSSDGAIVAEHGHQIDDDLNKFKHWPNVTSTAGYLDRPWGELVVQSLFNEVETAYPIVDNVLPLQSGLQYYMSSHGPIGKVEDVARLIYFNAVQISVRQMIDLGGGVPGEPPPPINPEKVRKQLGYKLIAYALPFDDNMRKQLVDPKQSQPQWLELRDAMQAMVMNKIEFPDDQVQTLCDVLQTRAAEELRHGRYGPTCSATLGGDSQTLGRAAYSALTQRENDILNDHIRKHWRKGGKLKIYIYGHTHEAREIDSLHGVAVYNTGAFQRVITDRALQADASPGADGATLLSRPLETLPSCYTAVVVKYADGVPSGELRTWHMDENDNTGSFVKRCSRECAAIAPECR